MIKRSLLSDILKVAQTEVTVQDILDYVSENEIDNVNLTIDKDKITSLTRTSIKPWFMASLSVNIEKISLGTNHNVRNISVHLVLERMDVYVLTVARNKFGPSGFTTLILDIEE